MPKRELAELGGQAGLGELAADSIDLAGVLGVLDEDADPADDDGQLGAVGDFLDDLALISSDSESDLPPAPEPGTDSDSDECAARRPVKSFAAAPEEHAAQPDAAAGPAGAALALLAGRPAAAADVLAGCGAVLQLAGAAADVGGSGSQGLQEFLKAGGVARLTQLLGRFSGGGCERGEEVLDALSAAIAAAVGGVRGSSSRPAWRTVAVGGAGHTVSVQQLPYELAGTGHTLWTAGLVQACWLAAGGAAARCLAGKTVCELGAGVGVCGLLLRKYRLAASITLTDCVPAVVESLSAALARQCSVDGGGEGGTAGLAACRCEGRAALLDWAADAAWAATEDDAAEAAASSSSSAGGWYGMAEQPAGGGGAVAAALDPSAMFDVLLGSDVLYEPDHPGLLWAVTRRRLVPGGLLHLVCPIRSSAHNLVEELLTRLTSGGSGGAAEAGAGGAAVQEGPLCELVEDRPVETASGSGSEFALNGLPSEGALQHSDAYPGGMRMLVFRRCGGAG